MRTSNATGQSQASICTLFRVGNENDFSPNVYIILCVFLATTNIAIALLTIPGNIVIFFAFSRTSSLRTPSNMLLLCLSICDFLAGIFAEPFHAAEIILAMNDPVKACTMKDFYSISMFITTVASVVSLSFISVERYLAVFHPLQHSLWVTKSKVFTLMISFWLIWSLVTGLTHTEHGFGTWGYSCFGTIGLCLPVILFVNFKLFMETRRHIIAIQSCSVGDEERRKQMETKAVKMTVWLVGLFLVCNLPILIIFLFRKVGKWKGQLSTIAWLHANTFSLCSSCVNPFLYFWKKRDIREAVTQMLKRKSEQQKGGN